LIHSLVMNQAGDGIAISNKGKTAAEMMVFSRYVMFSEVYWHHAVRSATAMLQRAFYLWFRAGRPFEPFAIADENSFVAHLRRESDEVGCRLLDGIFGAQRSLYKRLLGFNVFEAPELYQQLARRPYSWLCDCGRYVAEALARETGLMVDGNEVLIDAPPIGLEVQFDVNVWDPSSNRYRNLAEISPVVRALAAHQFDDFVKQVRVFVHPRLVQALSNIDAIEIFRTAIDDYERRGEFE